MTLTTLIAKHIREVHFGGNWTDSNLRDQLADVNWQTATAKLDNLNTIAALVFHINYYVGAIVKVLEGGPLDASDKFSFDVPPIQSEADWQALLEKTWRDADTFVSLIEKMPEAQLWDTFADPRYGDFYKNLVGVTEHAHYHLGQIAMLKKLLAGREARH
jgi:hypothetical protein